MTQELPKPAAQGWDSISSDSRWNSMRAPASGDSSGWGVPESTTVPGPAATANAMAGNATAGNAMPGNAMPGNATAGNSVPNASTNTAQGQWFTAADLYDEPQVDEFADDDEPNPPAGALDGLRGRFSLPGRLNLIGPPSFGPGFVTLAVSLVSALLVVSSIVWHPHVP